MRLALALEYPLMQQGGTEVLVRELLRGLAREHELILISGDRDRASLPAEMANLLAEHLHWDAAAPSRAAALALVGRLSHARPNLIHWHLGYTYAWQGNRFWRSPVYLAAQRGLRALCTTHLANELLDTNCDLARPAWQKLLLLLRAWPSRLLAHRGIAREICVSQHDARLLRAHFPPRRHRVGQLYHSLLHLEDAPPLEPQREKAVLCVGTLGGRKAQHLLAEAFARIAAQHRDWRLDFIGRMSVTEEVERIRASATRHQCEGQVHLHGRLDDEATLARVRRAAIFAMPSLHEGLGLSLQEALFHGCVAVGSRAGGIPELIDHGSNGLLITPGSVEELSAALDRLMSDEALRHRLASAARPSILRKGMTAEAMLENYRSLYAELRP
jgi:glycosyltransferase involved in cell wall biosynthesis